MKNFEELIKTIKQYVPDAICEKITLAYFKDPLLLVAIKGTKQKISIYSSINSVHEIANISYTNNKRVMHLSSFEVEEEHQQKGIGRFLFELATAHVDITGAFYLYGQANPTNNIKGISDSGGDTFKREQKALVRIYERLGCIFKDDNNFEQSWINGDKIKKIDKQTLEIAQKIASQDEFCKPIQMQ